jgi:hypothetical protein
MLANIYRDEFAVQDDRCEKSINFYIKLYAMNPSPIANFAPQYVQMTLHISYTGSLPLLTTTTETLHYTSSSSQSPSTSSAQAKSSYSTSSQTS